MPVSDSFREWLLEQLNRVRPVTDRRMFGGLGLYADGVFFGAVDDDVVFFRTGGSNRADYEARGMKPFRPMGPDTKPMAYHEVPADVLERIDELTAWMTRAIAEAALNRRTKPKASKPAPKPSKARRK
jgi:DNA transformation protein and related proteins